MSFMALSKIPNKKSIPIILQGALVCSKFPSFTYKIVNHHTLVLTGEIRPTSFSDSYKVEITYRFRRFPKVKILSHKIPDDAPHTFDNNYICTYYFDYNIWNSKMRLADVIVPWVADWLNNYELWQVTGEWHGRSHPKHPRRGQNAA
ncbi:hypothetical protein [Halobacteriovorax sp. YZS-1-2]|uniref:hypothetical protein n=1 Tax=Halobacteriovorax sp. YZS-1-2 TaxID=3391177 RepID=UPI00399BB8A7